MISNSNSTTGKANLDAGSASHPRFRFDRLLRGLELTDLGTREIRVLERAASYLNLGRRHRLVGRDEFRVAVSELAVRLRMRENDVRQARKVLEARGLIVCVDKGNQQTHVPPTYRIDMDALQTLRDQAVAARGDECVDTLSERGADGSSENEPGVPNGTHPGVPNGTPRGCQTEPPGGAKRNPSGALGLSVAGVSDETRAAGAAPPSGRVPQTEGDQTEEAEPDTAPSLHLAAQQSAPAPSGKKTQAGRLSAGDSSAWVPEEVPTPGSGVRKKKGKKRSAETSRSEAPSAALAAPPARPHTSVRSTPRALPASGPGPLSVRTPFSAPAGAPAPRTVPPYPTVTAVWSGNAAGAAPALSADERDFLARYTAAEKVVRAAKLGIGCDLLDGEALGDLCARTFAEHFPRGYSAELLAFKASRTLAMKDAHAIHEAAEARRRAREAEEEALAERAHKKKRSA